MSTLPQIHGSNKGGKNHPKGLKTTVVLSLVSAVLLIGVIGTAQASQTDDEIINKYCIDNALRVSMGENVISDLIGAGLVSADYANKTCADVKVQSEIDQSWRDTMNDLVVPYNP